MNADPLLMPAQISALDTALRHVGYHEKLLPSFLQTSTTALQSQEWLFLGLVGFLSTVLLVGGFAFWFKDSEHAKIDRWESREDRKAKASKHGQHHHYIELIRKASE